MILDWGIQTVAFILEKITEDIKQSIVSDAASDANLQSLMQYAAKENHLTKSRAIDYETGCYLMMCPTIVRDDRCDIGYLFYCIGTWYEFYLNTPFSVDARFRKEVNLTGEDFEALTRRIKNAFSVHGYFGLEDDREQAVVLNFQEENN
ncbi:hypothetical protein L1F30_01930 [Simiduia sp. 21SJ11W-1]|uniref:hypothetical protein n=1 Tax=Simiduia sp. 21SJ11W-1 TaxID=2909669 RepID=UPI00209E9D64|nr:hypothetical protein [Simiduia sp. 21SJ11W-1]UTA48314.1 hypothetical protein L1F30_01930 [Simiduia sp. 21SJ11W-1]